MQAVVVVVVVAVIVVVVVDATLPSENADLCEGIKGSQCTLARQIPERKQK